MRHLLRKLIGWMLCLAMAVGMLPMVTRGAKAADYTDSQGINYTVNASDMTASVKSYSGVSGDVSIPASITVDGQNYAVTSIWDHAFDGCTGLTRITIPDSVTSIWDYAFYKCTGLTSIAIPDSVTLIGNRAFEECTGLTSITISNSVTSIGDFALSKCTGLTSITIPNSVTSIGALAFYKCTGLTSITIPNSVTNIGYCAFQECTGLTSITIPNSVTNIDGGAFDGCTGLTSITIPNSVTNIGEGAFSYCTGLTSITIPNSVNSIRGGAFMGCTGLTSITIPNSVTSIEYSAFLECTSLTSITIPNSVTSIWENAFLYCTNLTSIFIKKGLDISQAGIPGVTTIWRYEVISNADASADGKIHIKLTGIDQGNETSIRDDAMGEGYQIDEIEVAGRSLVCCINDATDLKNFTDRVNNGETSLSALLLDDIDLSSFENWTPIGTENKPYAGTFDGNDKKIKGLTFDNSSRDCVGLFGYVGTGGNVKNVVLEGGSISGNDYVGGVVGYNEGTVKNCHNTGAVAGHDYVGGVVGYNIGVTVTNCYNTGAVSGNETVGGVVGKNSVEVENCYNTGAVSGGYDVGGVVGFNESSGTVENCYNTGAVSGDVDNVGGVVGDNFRTVLNCYNTGSVAGINNVGGVVGFNTTSGTVENCYYDTCACRVAYSIGFGSAGTNVEGLTTAQMTGEGMIGLKFTWEAGKESPWLEMNDSASGDSTYWHYPHLKGFEYDNDKSEVNWPAKIEVTVKWDSDSYTYNGAEQNPSVNGVLVVFGDTIIPDALKKMNIRYFCYNSANGWGNVDDYSAPGYYKMEFYEDSSSPAIAIKYFSVLETGDISVNHGGTASWTDAGTYTALLELKKYGDKTISGEFKIEPAYVTITAQDKEFTYTGEAQNWNQYDVEGLFGNDRITAVVTGSITYPNESPVTNKLESYEFTTGKAGNYNVTKKNGTLTMTQARIPITITAASQEWVYDGQAHENAEVTITSGALLTGDELVASATGSITSVSDNKEGNNPVAAGYKIMHGDKDVTENYVITTVPGTLKLSKKALTITADSASKEYDKTELTKDSYTVSGLANGDTIKSVTITGSQTMKGSSDNVPSAAKIVNAKGEDVTACYEITYKNGTLTVTAPQAPDLTDDQKPNPKKDLKEDGKEQILVLDPANLPDGYTIEYSTDGGKTWKPIPTGKESGEYTIEVFYKADENHTDFFGDPLNVIIQGVYNQTESDGDWTKGSGKTYTFRIKKAFNDEVTYDNLTGVFVDGKKAEPGKDYTPAKGSAIITFASDYLETLAVGEHMIRVVFKDGEILLPLKILEAVATPTTAVDATPVTGDAANPFLWTALVLLSMAGLAVMIEKKRRKA